MVHFAPLFRFGFRFDSGCVGTKNVSGPRSIELKELELGAAELALRTTPYRLEQTRRTHVRRYQLDVLFDQFLL
eukprot:SAG31_NODE_18734_length_624_cov_1.613333_1_plen_73_part_01